DGEVAWLGTPEDLVHEGGGAPFQVTKVCAVDHETAGLHVLGYPKDRRQASLRREPDNLSDLVAVYGIRGNHDRPCVLPGHRGEGAVDFLRIPRLHELKLHSQRLRRAMTMGVVIFTSLQARVTVGPAETMTSTLRRTSSAASAGRRSSFPSAHICSMTM